MPKKSSVIPGLPGQCVFCECAVLKGERRHLVKQDGRYHWSCHSCWTPPPLNENWLKQFGNTRINGFPVDKDKKTTSIDRAVGFRRFRINANNEREIYYVKRKATSTSK